MKALCSTAAGVRLEERPEPSLRPGEVLVAVRLAGICNTDLEIARGYLGFRGVLGHEVLGELIAGPGGAPVPETLRGQRVALEINCACGVCSTCRAGGRNHCPTRTVIGILGRDGGLAERLAIPLENVHLIPDTVSDEQAIFVEPLAAALHAFDEAALRPGDRVLVVGDGKLGLLIGLALAARRGDLGRALAVGRHRSKLAVLEAAGLEVKLEADFIASATADFDVVVEATGQPAGLALALSVLRPRGALILKSTYAGQAAVDLAPIVIKELRVIGSRCGDFPRAIAALAESRIDPRPLLSNRFPLEDAEAAFRHAASPGVLKILVQPGL